MKCYRVGLTGGIASGKSTVSNILKDRGYCVIDADRIAHALMEPGGENYDAIVEAFGTEILAVDQTIDRRRLGGIVFSDPIQRKKLNDIVHPRIYREMQNLAVAYEESLQIPSAFTMQEDANSIQYKIQSTIVFDVALLFEQREYMKLLQLDETWMVWAPPKVQIERLMARDGFTRAEAKLRIESQMRIDDKRALADVVIENDKDITWLIHQITQIEQRRQQ